jgi:hypothetical protein
MEASTHENFVAMSMREHWIKTKSYGFKSSFVQLLWRQRQKDYGSRPAWAKLEPI